MNQSKHIRPAAVAGMFYPSDTLELREHVARFIDQGSYTLEEVPKAIIVPHAGTIYSGSVAAHAYRSILSHRQLIKKIILLGPAHYVQFQGLALPTADAFQTPLGNVPLDVQSIQNIVQTFPQVSFSDEAHTSEHALEVQLPFLQETVAQFQLIPMVVGAATPALVAEVLDEVWGSEECLIVISTDLSHFFGYEKAVALDRETAGHIERLEGERLGDHSACGRIPLKGLLQVARQKHLTIKRFDLRNSGDTSGRKDQVVGYGAWGLFE